MNKSQNLKSGKKEQEKPVVACDYCQKEFQKPSQLKQHVTVHTGQKDFRCNLCDYSAAHKGNLTVHMQRHLNEQPFKCQEPNCEATFTQSSHLKRHQLVHKKNEKTFSCSACPFKTHAKIYLTQHLKSVHCESRPFKCPHENCKYSAKQKSKLSRHLKIHFEEKNQVCRHPNCGFRTKWPGALKTHMETHATGEKLFKCHFCSYASHQHSNLVRHIRRHTGETPFACQLCPFKSKDKSHLNRHMKTH